LHIVPEAALVVAQHELVQSLTMHLVACAGQSAGAVHDLALPQADDSMPPSFPESPPEPASVPVELSPPLLLPELSAPLLEPSTPLLDPSAPLLLPELSAPPLDESSPIELSIIELSSPASPEAVPPPDELLQPANRAATAARLKPKEDQRMWFIVPVISHDGAAEQT
jgi:hypothetical protein